MPISHSLPLVSLGGGLPHNVSLSLVSARRLTQLGHAMQPLSSILIGSN